MAISERAGGLGRVWTVPNALSLGRLLAAAAFVVLLFTTSDRFVPAALLAFSGVTDFLDGFIARRFDQVTTIGKILDPSVDRIVLVTTVIALAVFGALAGWIAAFILVRESIVAVGTVALALAGASRIDVLLVGKAGTFGLMLCLPLFLLGDGNGGWAHVVTDCSWVILVPSLACSIAALLAYVPQARRALAAGRQASY